MTRLKLVVIASLLVLSSIAHADLPCREGGVVATSSNGGATVVASAHGCRAYPTAQYTVRVGGRDVFTIPSMPGHETMLVSDTGRTILLLSTRNVRADQEEVVAFRDGRRFGSYLLADILGATTRAVREGRFVDVQIEGVYLVIKDVDGTQLYREHLAVLQRN